MKQSKALFIALITILLIIQTVLATNQVEVCTICSKCSTCTQDVNQDPFVDSIHLILAEKFPEISKAFPVIIQRTLLGNSLLGYRLVYDTSFSATIKLNSKTGEVSIDSYESRNSSLANQKCKFCNSSQISSNVQTETSALRVISSSKGFFNSVREISLISATQKLLGTFVFKKYFETSEFRSLVFGTQQGSVNLKNLKLMYFKSYSLKYYRLVYLFLNEQSNPRAEPGLWFYELIVSQDNAGYNLVQASRIDERELAWDRSLQQSSGSTIISLLVRKEKIIDSSRFEVSTLSFSQTQSQTSQQSVISTGASQISTFPSTIQSNTTSTQLFSSQSSEYDYQEIVNFQSSEEVRQVELYLKDYLSYSYSKLQLRKVEKEYILKGRGQSDDEIISFRLTYRVIKYEQNPTEPLHYEIIVTKYQKAGNKVVYQVLNSNYINLLPISEIRSQLDVSVLNSSQVKQDLNLPYIDQLVLKEFQTQLGQEPPIVKIKRHEPYYELSYMDLSKRLVKITLLYEVVLNTIEFYVEGQGNSQGNISISSSYEYLTDSGKRASGSVQSTTQSGSIGYFSTPSVSTQTTVNSVANSSITDSKPSVPVIPITAKSQHRNEQTSIKGNTTNNTSINSSIGSEDSKKNQSVINATVTNSSTVRVNTTTTSNVSGLTSNATLNNTSTQSPSLTANNESTALNINNLTIIQLPAFDTVSINQSQFKEVSNYFSSSEVSKLVNYLLAKYGQSLNYFMKLVQVQYQEPKNDVKTVKRTIYKLIFEIRRYESLSQAGANLTQGTLKYEVIFDYNLTLSTGSVSIQIISSNYANPYSYISQPNKMSSAISQLYSSMSFDQSSLLSDQYYVNINQLLMSYELMSSNGNVVFFKDLIKNAYVKRVGRLLPYYIMEFSNGLSVLGWYEVLSKHFVLMAILNNLQPLSSLPNNLNPTVNNPISNSNVNTTGNSNSNNTGATLTQNTSVITNSNSSSVKSNTNSTLANTTISNPNLNQSTIINNTINATVNDGSKPNITNTPTVNTTVTQIVNNTSSFPININSTSIPKDYGIRQPIPIKEIGQSFVQPQLVPIRQNSSSLNSQFIFNPTPFNQSSTITKSNTTTVPLTVNTSTSNTNNFTAIKDSTPVTVIPIKDNTIITPIKDTTTVTQIKDTTATTQIKEITPVKQIVNEVTQIKDTTNILTPVKQVTTIRQPTPIRQVPQQNSMTSTNTTSSSQSSQQQQNSSQQQFSSNNASSSNSQQSSSSINLIPIKETVNTQISTTNSFVPIRQVKESNSSTSSSSSSSSSLSSSSSSTSSSSSSSSFSSSSSSSFSSGSNGFVPLKQIKESSSSSSSSLKGSSQSNTSQDQSQGSILSNKQQKYVLSDQTSQYSFNPSQSYTPSSPTAYSLSSKPQPIILSSKTSQSIFSPIHIVDQVQNLHTSQIQPFSSQSAQTTTVQNQYVQHVTTSTIVSNSSNSSFKDTSKEVKTDTTQQNSTKSQNQTQKISIEADLQQSYIPSQISVLNRQSNTTKQVNNTTATTTATVSIQFSLSNQVSSRVLLKENELVRTSLQTVYIKPKQTINISSIPNFSTLVNLNLMSNEQLPTSMANDFMSPYYLIFREDFIIKNQSNSNTKTNTSAVNLPFNVSKFTQILIRQFIKFNNIISVQSLPAFEILMHHSVFTSGYRVIISCPSLKKVYEIIFLTLNYQVISFKEVQSLKEMTLRINEKLFTIAKSLDSQGKPIDVYTQYELIKKYSPLIKVFAKGIQVQEIKEVKISFVPEGLKYFLSYEGRRKTVLSSGRQIVKKEWFFTEFIYETDSQSLKLSKHQLYKPDFDFANNRLTLLSDLKSEENYLKPQLTPQQLSKARLLSVQQAKSFLVSLSSQTENLTNYQAAVFQSSSQGVDECYVSVKYLSSKQISSELIFTYSFVWQRVISVEIININWFVTLKTYDRRLILSVSLSQLQKQVLEKSKQTSMKLFKNQIMVDQSIPEVISSSLILSTSSQAIQIFKITFNSPIIYQLFIKVTIKKSSNSSVLKVIGVRKYTEQVTVADQFFDQTNKQSEGYQSLDLIEVKNDQVYTSLMSIATKQNSTIITGKILQIYYKQTLQHQMYRVILQVSSKIYILIMKANKFNIVSNFISFYADSTIPINGFYQRNCQKQSSKGYCVICNNQFTQSEYLISNGRCYSPIQKCQAQLAYKCIICSQGFQIFNNTCVSANAQSTQSKKIQMSMIQSNITIKTALKERICKTFDVRGNCVECPEEDIYVLYESTCLQRASLILNKNAFLDVISPQQADIVNSDLFCKRWISNICIDCIQGTMMTATRRCQASKQNCITYNFIDRQCEVCAKDYKNLAGRCLK